MLMFEKNVRAYVSDLNNIAYMSRIAVRQGCSVVERSPTIMGVRVNAGTVFFGNNSVSVVQQDLVISPSDPSYDRIDLVVVNDSGTASVITGLPEIEPHTPDYDPESYVVLARVFVDDLSTIVVTANITDIRIINSGVGTFGKYVESGIIAQTSVVVQHGLNDTEPVIICYDALNKMVIPESITIDSSIQITATFNPAFTGKIIVQGGAAGAGGSLFALTVKDDDGTPTVLSVNEIRVSNGSLTDDGGGAVSIDISAQESYIHNQVGASNTWVINHNLGQQVVSVQCYDSAGYWIQPNTIQLNSANQCTITFLSSESGDAIIKK